MEKHTINEGREKYCGSNNSKIYSTIPLYNNATLHHVGNKIFLYIFFSKIDMVSTLKHFFLSILALI